MKETKEWWQALGNGEYKMKGKMKETKWRWKTLEDEGYKMIETK